MGVLTPWEPRPPGWWRPHDTTKEVSVMADEGYKLQISVKVSPDTMVNVRADDVDELVLTLTNLEEADNEGLQAVAALIAEDLGGGSSKPKKSKSKKKSSKKKSRDEDDEEDDEDEGDDEEEDDEEEEDKPKRKKRTKGKRSRR